MKLLSVAVDRLERWRAPGFLAIGDAAHAMSPIGGVGINLAVQDAVAAANRLAAPLLARTLTEGDLAAVERRRLFPVRVTQWIQVKAQNNVVAGTLGQSGTIQPPFAFRLLTRSPFLRRLMARLVGLGVRPERMCRSRAAMRPRPRGVIPCA